jgi:hypothetical protein
MAMENPMKIYQQRPKERKTRTEEKDQSTTSMSQLKSRKRQMMNYYRRLLNIEERTKNYEGDLNINNNNLAYKPVRQASNKSKKLNQPVKRTAIK